MGTLVLGADEFDADKVIAQLKATALPEMLAGLEAFKRCSKSKQVELLALQMQHLLAAMASHDELLRHVHERVCYMGTEEDEEDLELVN
jgi:hypothetical protein